MDSVHRPWTTSGLGPQWTGHGRRHRAHRRGGVREERRSGDGGEGGGGRNSGAERARARGAWKWGAGMSKVRRASSSPFSEGGAGWPDVGGERAAATVRHNGMKAAISEGNRSGVGGGWGVMRSRCSDRYGSGGGVCAHKTVAAAVGPGRKMTGRDPHVCEGGEGKAGWAD
jgi:hypothetical protein